jgi:hypothetical protein
MRVLAETEIDHRGVETIRRFHLDGRAVEVDETLDQWHGADHRYFKVRSGDGDVYILRHDEVRQQWDLTMYQRARAQDTVLSADTAHRPRHRATMLRARAMP